MTDPKPTPEGSKARAAKIREKRRAEALRANLRRRKEQARARTPEHEDKDAASDKPGKDG